MEGHPSRRDKSPSHHTRQVKSPKKPEENERIVRLITLDGKEYCMSRATLSKAKYFKALFSENWNSHEDGQTLHLVGTYTQFG